MKRLSAYILALLILAPASLLAHPLGTRMWGHETTITPRDDSIQIDYTIEIPTTKLAFMMNRFRASEGLAELSPLDQAKFNDGMMDHISSGIHVDADGHTLPCIWNPNYAKEGLAGEPGFFEYHIHLLCKFNKPIETAKVDITNDNYPIQKAVFLNAIRTGYGGSAKDINFPKGMGWQTGEKYRKMEFTYVKDDSTSKKTHAAGSDTDNSDTHGDLLSYLKHAEAGFTATLIALAMALLLGMLHALSPGHGKALVAAYLVGSEGTARHAIILAVVVTFAHVFSVIILGFAGLILAEYMVPEYYAPIISLISGVIIVSIGTWLFIRRFVRRNDTHAHSHAAPSMKQLMLMGISGGIVPCPSATVVMLTAVAIGRVAFGLALIAVFSIGLAITLLIVGLITIRAASAIERLKSFEKLSKILPIVSATIVVIVGFLIIYQGFWKEWVTP